jgi:NTE family protein
MLKVLERERIPVDLIAGTSMGAIIGGPYASGMTAADLERQHLSQRRKEEDFEFSAVMERGMRDDKLRAPQGTLSSRCAASSSSMPCRRPFALYLFIGRP